MAYCHECGSEVAENDIFCPYCGITLQPMTFGGINDSQNDAVVAEETESAFGQAANAATANPESVSDKNLIIARAENYPKDSTAENLQTKTKSVEMPEDFAGKHLSEEKIPKVTVPEKVEILKPLGEENQGILTGAASENAEIAKQDAQNRASEQEIVSSISQKEKIAETQNESSLMNYEEAEVKEGKEFEEAELREAENRSVSEEDLEFTTTIPYIPKDLKYREDFAAIKSAAAEPAADASEKKSSQDEYNPQNPAAAPIAKPAAELEKPAENCPPSRFDSVRIYEKKEEFKERKTILKSAPEIKEQEPQNEGRSFTTPNIGGTNTDGKRSSKLKPLEEGTVLNGRYEIVRKIGGGGMGAVYLASDKNLGGVLRAVKEMVQSYIEGEQQEKAVNDFKRESLLLTSLEHQSIPTIYDYFYDEREARFYLVMKYISGGDLASRLRAASEGRIDELSVTEWAIQLADVLDYLHNRQPPIVYRDLKPANIMIDGNTGRVMLIDFGIARWVNKEEKGVTAVGTMGYAPPELFSGNVEPRSDIYSLGSTMFHLLTGADPQSNPLLIFDFQKHPRPRQINPQLSDQMERILMRSVEYNADRRFASAAELRAILEEHLKSLKANKATFGVKDAPQSVSLAEQPVFCGFCGQKIIATDLFCAFCGAKQPLAQKGVQSQQYSPAPRTAQLLIVGTNELEVPSFRIEKDNNLVGRRDPMSNIFPEVDLSKYDPQTKISRKHARIWREGSDFMVEDLGSSNGTIVLPVISDTIRLLPHKPYALNNGDKLKLGDTTLHFVIS